MFFPRVTGSFALLSLAIGLGVGGCKDEETNVSGYVDAWSRKVCDAVLECSCDYDGGAQMDHCLSQLGVAGSTEAELNQVEGLKFDGECADRQLSELERLGCGVLVADPDAKCERPCKVWHGPMGTGATCTGINGYDNCGQGLVCDEGVCVNPCAEPDLPRIGEPCAAGFGCEEGAWCDVASTPLAPVCAALPLAGQPCLADTFGYACGEGLQCDLSDPDAPVCAAPPGLGEECPDGLCAEDLYCNTTEAPAVCAALPGLSESCPLGVCAAPNLCEGGICVEPRPQVCGFYGGVPEGLGESGVDTVDETSGAETGDLTGGLETGGLETGGLDTSGLEGDCCAPHGGLACEDAQVAACVCGVDPLCCGQEWTQACADLVVTEGCGVC